MYNFGNVVVVLLLLLLFSPCCDSCVANHVCQCNGKIIHEGAIITESFLILK